MNIFKDKSLAHQFELNGYITLPFLNQDAINELRHFYLQTHPQTPAGFYSSSFSNDEPLKEKIISFIEEKLSNQIDTYFQSVNKLGSCFLTKNTGDDSNMPIHQDWTIVDENQWQTLTIWIPLQDVDAQNGALEVVQGSHRFFSAIRAPSLPSPTENIENILRKDLKSIPLKAGEAIIFSHALIHASPPNLSPQPRIAITYGLTPQAAELCFYHYNEEKKLEKYKVDPCFFQNYNTQIGQRPKFGKRLETIEYYPSPISKKEYQEAQTKYHFAMQQNTIKMKPLFINSDHQNFFQNNGYIVLPLLRPEEVNELKAYYESFHLNDEKGFGFHVSMDQADKGMCKNIREKIWQIAVPQLKQHLHDFKPFVASYVIKEVNPKGVVPAHQDWSFVDHEEEGFFSVTCWIALVDTHLDNGGMGVIKGSHLFMQNHRPSPSPQAPVPLSEHMFSIFPYLHTLEVKAGEVLMFDNRTFHASPPNTSNGIRLAAGIGITQANAQLIHYYLKPGTQQKTLLKFKVDEDFFLKYENATLSKMYDAQEIISGYGEPEEVAYEYKKYDTDELVALIKASGNDYNIPMTEKLAKLFGYTSNQESKEEKQKNQEEEINLNSNLIEPITENNLWIDNRSFFEKYTPINILKEVKKRFIDA